MGFEYIEHFSVNERTAYEKPNTLEALNQNIKSCHLCD